MIPPKLIRLFLPKEVKDMLDKLKGSRTLLLLVIANLPDATQSLVKIVSGVWGDTIADDLTQVVAGFIAVLTVLVRLIPEPPAQPND